MTVTDKKLKEKRTFPTGNTVLLVVLVVIQILAVVLAAVFEPTSQDVIRQYSVTVEPKADGTLDITYFLHWKALDTSEELTWVEIGMANPDYSVYRDGFSSNIHSWSRQDEDGYVTLRLDFTDSYIGGEELEFSFKVNQKNMLCRDVGGYFYEFVPGWFNSTPVENYDFRWLVGESTGAKDAVTEGAYYSWTGSFECGGYQKMFVRYSETAFDGCETADYSAFDDSGAYNGLSDDKQAAWVMAVLLILVLLVIEVYIIDSYVSYHRGRGFLTGYGHHVHVYGRTNPRYVREREKHAARSSGGGRSGGCACACACACAGGGRAGCSQKDTRKVHRK